MWQISAEMIARTIVVPKNMARPNAEATRSCWRYKAPLAPACAVPDKRDIFESEHAEGLRAARSQPGCRELATDAQDWRRCLHFIHHFLT